ncbi:MAG: long-chain fatty acid--CoA ligase [Desulfobulbaceae bacterium]|jgi:long-chain acyl-CoA synthetase|nr:long-chain fatty acid--CoA ligase [Desulfobulbaceae bacterium]
MDFLAYNSILSVIKNNIGHYGPRTAVSYKKKGKYLSLTYEQFYERVLMHARGLAKIGVRPGDRVAIFSENRLGWAIADFSIQACRAISAPVYATDTGHEAAYIINHSEAEVVFVSTRQQYEKLLSVRELIPRVRMVVSFEQFIGDKSFPVVSQFQLSEPEIPLSEEKKKQIEAGIDAVHQDDILTIIYTSGTTGVPKGVVLSQGNIMSNAHYGLQALDEIASPMTFLSFLPLSHVFERSAGYYANLMLGNHVAFAENPKVVMENMSEIRPEVMVSVPRLFEKIHSRVYDSAHQAGPFKQKLFHRALAIGQRYVEKKYVHQQNPGLLSWQYLFYDKLVFSAIRKRFGGRIKFFLCGGAPLDEVITRFMWAIGMPVFNGYGLTETSPVICVCNRQNIRFASVGKALAKTEVKLAEDGELLMRGPQLMQGYYKNEEATREAMGDGWFRTGDIARIDEEGFIYIVDRKKELIVTAGGKNVAPQPLEGELRLSKYIEQAIVIGDRRPYLVAILTPNLERLFALSRELDIHFIDMHELVNNPRIVEVYQSVIDKLNADLPSYSTIKNFAVLAGDFTIADGELTSTMKLKRRVISRRYKDLIEELYAAADSRIDMRNKPVTGA